MWNKFSAPSSKNTGLIAPHLLTLRLVMRATLCVQLKRRSLRRRQHSSPSSRRKACVRCGPFDVHKTSDTGNTLKCACACGVTLDVNKSCAWRHGDDVVWWRRPGRHVKCLSLRHRRTSATSSWRHLFSSFCSWLLTLLQIHSRES